MRTGNRDGPPQASREWGYSRGWRRFSVIVLRPLLMLVMKYRWQGREYLPRILRTCRCPSAGLITRRTIQTVAGPPVDLSAYAGQRLSASTLRAATAAIMADITELLAKIRQETPPAVPWDPAAGGRVRPMDRTVPGVTGPPQEPSPPQSAHPSARHDSGGHGGRPAQEEQWR